MSATADLVIDQLRTTLKSVFRVLDVQWKRESATAWGARNDADAAYINVRAADPATGDDVSTKRYVDSLNVIGGF
jgi:hypothetical protein